MASGVTMSGRANAKGSKQLSEISITLLWMQQGKASNHFEMFSQALQECTGSPQTHARWRLAAYTPLPHALKPWAEGCTVLSSSGP